MNDHKERDEVAIDGTLAAIREVWLRHPTFRFGQLIAASVDPPDMCPKLFGMGDEILVQHIESLGRRLNAQK